MNSIFKVKNLLVVILVFATLQSCAQDKVESKAYQVMLQGLLSHDVDEVFVADNFFEDTTIIYLDAREKEEFDVSHIKNAIWVGYDDFDLSRVEALDKTAKILVYCSVGYRSEKVTEKLNADGFKNASNLYGGIFEWKNQEKTVVDSTGQLTNNIHAFDKTWGIWLKEGVKVYK